MPARKIHDASVGPSLTIPVCCDRTRLLEGDAARPEAPGQHGPQPRDVPALPAHHSAAHPRGAPQAGAGGMTAEGRGASRAWQRSQRM
jgi:hypothetical protein